jgi:hypothetical protein
MRHTGVLLLAAVLAFAPALPASATPPAPATARDHSGPARADYDVRLTGDRTGTHWHGRTSIGFTNTTARPLTTVWFRLWGNGVDGCAAPAVHVGRVSGGTAGNLAVGCTALPVRLAHPLAPGARTSVGMDVDIAVPDRDTRFGRHAGAAYVTFALPVLAVHHRDGWHLEPYSNAGESNYTLTADWRVRLDHPSALAVPVSGVATARPGRPGRTVTTARAPRVRDFAFAAGPFAEHTARTADGVLVRLWQGGDVTAADAAAALADAVTAMETFADWYGAYPYPEVDVVTGDFPYGSMEYPTLVTAFPGSLAVTHELAHQWWYALVGNNQYADPWLDESITHYSAVRLTGEPLPFDCTEPEWFTPTDRLDHGMDYWETNSTYGVVYLVGACMMFDLEQTLGSDRMLAMLRRYVAGQRYGISTPAEFRAAAQAASPVDLTPFWANWRVD